VEFSIRVLAPERAKTACLVVGVFKGKTAAQGELTPAARRVDRAAHGALRAVLAQGDLSGRAGSTTLLRQVAGLAAERVLLVGLGEKDEFKESSYRDVIRSVATALKNLGVREATLYLVGHKLPSRDIAWNVRQATLGLREAGYVFDQLKSKKEGPPPALAEVTLALPTGSVPAPASRALREAVATADGAALAKTLGNLPSNICTPTYLANEAKKLARQFKLRLDVLERRDMDRLGMGALVSVTKGSHQPPKLIVLHYAGAAKSKKPVVLVGKGVTFDTGGISLKPGAEMDEMKYDMSGAASVLGTLRALAGMKAPVNVIGVVPAVENMPGGGASKPGDVVTTLSGQTVEILNTDAEGRLILCDALAYAERFKPRDDFLDENLGRRGARGHPDRAPAGDPLGLEVRGAVDHVGDRADMLGDFAQPVRIRAVARADHDHHLALRRHELDGVLPVLRRVADVVALRAADRRVARLERIHDRTRVVYRERGLRDIGDLPRIAHRKRGDIVHGLDQVHALRRLPHRALGLGVPAMPDHHHFESRGEHLRDLDMHLGHQRAGGVEHVQAARLGLAPYQLRHAVRAEDHRASGGNLVQLLYEDRPFGAQVLDHRAVVHDLVAHVDRRAVARERALDDLDRALDAGTKAARIGQDHFHTRNSAPFERRRRLSRARARRRDAGIPRGSPARRRA